jgi:hypothetical protein
MSLQLLNEILNHSNFKEIQNDLKLGYLSSKSLTNLKDIQSKLTLFLYNYEHDKKRYISSSDEEDDIVDTNLFQNNIFDQNYLEQKWLEEMTIKNSPNLGSINESYAHTEMMA